ncbi:MAG: hypothetical protein K2M91_00930 [Lachnospiraceae bacterium]|nr:hypothetical protein [Lachnospiraceae bacterium]
MNEKIKNEILKRYEILFEQGLIMDVEDWVWDGKILIIDEMDLFGNGILSGILFTLNEKPEYASYVEKIESEKGVKVFMGIVTHTMLGTLLSLMYVAATESEWEVERNYMKNEHIHCAYVFNLEEELCELGFIQYEMKDGGLVRSK